MTEAGEKHLERIFQAAAASEGGIPRARILRTTDKLFAGSGGDGESAGGRGTLCAAGVAIRRFTARCARMPIADRRQQFPACSDTYGNSGSWECGDNYSVSRGVWRDGSCSDARNGRSLVAESAEGVGWVVLEVAGAARDCDSGAAGAIEDCKVKIYAASARGEDASNPAKWDMRGAVRDIHRQRRSGFAGAKWSVPPTRQISIPMSDAVESLNAGVAASLLLYEVARNRKVS